MKAIFTIFLVAFGLVVVQAQCPTGDITLNTQAEVDAFGVSWPNCTDLADTLTIDGWDITNLSGLSGLTSVGASLTIINNPNLINLTGLESLSSVGENLWVYNNDALTSLTGLENLNSVGGKLAISENDILLNLTALENVSSVGGSLVVSDNDVLIGLTGLENINSVGESLGVYNNDVLTSLTGLENLNSVGEELSISGNYALTSLAALENLSSIGWSLAISDNDALSSLTGLENLSSLGGGGLWIYTNDGLTNLTGLDNLSSVGGVVWIYTNAGLTNLTGLENLSSVGGGLAINYNDALSSLTGLENINSVGGGLMINNNDALSNLTGLENLNSIGGDLTINYNPNLSVCSIWAVCQYLQNYDPTNQAVDINNNASGCNSQAEVGLGCGSFFSYVSGQVYADIDCNNAFDGADIYAPNFIVSKADGTPITITNSDGEYVVLLATNSTNTISVNALAGFTAQPDTYQIVTDTVVTSYTGYGFRLCPDSVFSDASVSMAALNSPRPGFSNIYHICYQNIGSLPTNATLTLTFSGEAAAYLSIVDANGGTVSGNSITWSLTDVPVFAQGCFTVVVSLLPTTPFAILLTANASISVMSGVITDSYENTQKVLGSFDPNDKTVSPTEIDFATAEGPQRLTYTVRFQNTGTFPATFVEVLDTLEANLDITTLQLLSASHAYTLTVLDDHILKFRFDNINLPDSTSDEAGSHGYIMFSLETVAGLQLGDVVQNSAAIYFDFNAPVITNTASTEFITPTLKPTAKMPLQVLPNPTRNTATVFFEGSSRTKIQLLNTLGNVLQQHEVSGSSLTLDVSALPLGVYFIRATSGAAMGAAKLVKE